jgi:septal ring factor EnvC (AmiA/AmiB activator)/glycosyltransferase involved in cell wall biosynthesis
MSGTDRLANNDDPLAACRDQIASREAAPAAAPADALPERRLGAPATVAGIPIASAILLPADHLHAESAWNQHIPFAFWLVQAHRPAIFVELGTFRGTSYFSFCQAVAALRLPTRCFAVDTWQGDSHTGFYDESVFGRVNACNELKYAGFSRLVRSSFDEALPHFLDGSIDLLHIDGLHTYEACRHDFESWLPKLSPRAIVLFHDTNVRERGFGVHQLWVELAARYPHFEFLHEHGLGVLGVGAELDPPLRELFAAADDAALTCEVRSTFWRFASAVQAKIDLKTSGEERARLETLVGVTIGECEAEVSRLTAELAGLRSALEEKERQAAELTAQFAAARSEKAGLGMELAEARSETAQLDKTLAEARSKTAQLDKTLAEAHSEKAQLESALAEARSETTQLESALAEARSETAQRDSALAEARSETAQLESMLAEARSETAQRDSALAEARGETTQLESTLAEARSEKAQLESALAAARSENAGLNDTLATARQVGTDQQAALHAKAAELAAVRSRGEWAEAAFAAARKELDAVRRSTSWRFTQPLRQIAARSRFARHAARVVKLPWWTMTFQLGARVREDRLRRANIKLIAASGLFDSDWYLEQYPDVRASGIDPLVHYLDYGANEDRDPNPLFDSDWYLDRYPAVRAAATNPLVHYLRYGRAEGCDPCGSFSTRDYLANNPDVAAIGMNPLVHYCGGAGEPRPTPADPDPQERAAVATYLVTNFAAARRQDARSNAPLIVCVCHVFPWLPRAGNEYRIARMLDWFSTRGHDLLVVVAPTEEDDLVEKRRGELFAKYANAMVCYRDGRVLASIKTLPLSFETLDRRPVAQVFQEIKRRAPATDEAFHHLEQHYCHDALIGILAEIARQDPNAIYYINYGFMTRFLQHLPRKPISFVDTHDIFSHKTTQVRNYGIADVIVTSEEEGRMLRRADAVIAIHNNDAQALKSLVPGKTVINVGVDFPATDVGPPSCAPNILLVAHLNPLNVKGTRDFLRFAWPLIKAAIPDAQFIVVGKIGQAIASGDRQVKIVGAVDSLEPYYRDARLVVNPAVAGTGLKIKTIEAIAYFRPVVAWPNGVDGVPPPLRGLCHVAENWYHFADQAIALLRDGEQWTKLAFDRAAAKRELSPDMIYNELSIWLSHLKLTL